MRVRWGRYYGCLQFVSSTLPFLESVGSRQRGREGRIESGRRGFGLSVFCLSLVLVCNVICLGEGVFFIHQPTIG